MEDDVSDDEDKAIAAYRAELCNEAAGNTRRCYEALVAATIFPSAELELVELWLENFRLAATKGTQRAPRIRL